MPFSIQTQAPISEAQVFVISPVEAEQPGKTVRTSEETAVSASAVHIAGSVVAAFLIVIFSAVALRFAEAKIRSSADDFSQAKSGFSNLISDSTKFLKLQNSYLFIPTAYAAVARPSSQVAQSVARPAPRAALKKYEAQFFIDSGKSLVMKTGNEAVFTVGFKNIGSETWRNDGKNYISVYSAKPYYRKSQFVSPLWENDVKPGRLRDARVAPGAIGYFEIHLKAPEKLGTYNEIFALAVEDTAWVSHGQVMIPITVTERPAYVATLLLKSDNDLVLKQGEEINVKVGWKNSGNVAWKERKVVSKSLEIASDTSLAPSLFASAKWPSSTESARISHDQVLPGQIGFVDFSLRAPARPGRFAIRFALIADGNEVEGGEVEFAGNVTDESATSNLPAIEPLGLSAEPNLRIGLCFIPYGAQDGGQLGIDPCAGSGQTLRVSAQVPLSLQNSSKATVAQNIGTSVALRFDPVSRFVVEANGGTYYFNDAVRIVPDDLSSVLVFDSWNNRIASGENDNREHGILEFRYIEDRNRVWVINELPAELYVKGLAEIPADWPLEVQKAQAIAARTFAIYYYLAGGKHASQEHILNAGSYDQVYHGVGAELRRPALSRAVDETRGRVATYGNGVISTPYFAQSDGRTRSWAEVYGSPARPWLQSVDAPYDLGKTRRGHGLGMSQVDAYGRAKSGATAEQILKHYYTGIELKRAY